MTSKPHVKSNRLERPIYEQSTAQPKNLTIQRKAANGGSEVPPVLHEMLRSPAPLQPKLAVSQPNDGHEQEADRVAQHLLKAPEQPIPIQQIERDNSKLATLPTSVHQTLSRPGQPMDLGLRRKMEQRFGVDFSPVRLYTSGEAARSAQDVNAHAYTVGRQIVFAPGQFAPTTDQGQQLIAHELTHVVQQSRRGQPSLHRFEARMHQRVERVGLTQGRLITDEEASAVYFGNWMRDMNQVFVPLLVDIMPADVVFAMISYMAATNFGRELTPEQFGYYIPAEHLDNPGGLVATDDLLPAQPTITNAARPPIPARLTTPRPAQLDTPQEDISPTTGTVQGVNIFEVDQTGVMAFLRRSNLHIERRLQLAANAGRNPEGMHHFGAALHAIEDLFAHSNYVEIAVDRLLRNSPDFLAQLTGADRQVFTYSQRIRTGEAGAPEAERPILTTGSFTGADTQISIASELTGFLSRPLPEPTTQAEQRAQDRFMVVLLQNFEAQLRANPRLREVVQNALREAGVPEFLTSRVDQLPLANIYQLQTALRLPIPDSVVIPMKRRIRTIVSEDVLQPLAGRLQAAALEARVADTSLIRVLEASQRQARGQFSAAEQESMRQQEQFSGRSVAQQQAAARAAGQRRVQAIQGTPIHVVAGPSHSQIGKDHANSPFFGLAFRLASLAVERLRTRMLAVWDERNGAATTPFNFAWSNFPQAAPAGSAPAIATVYEESRRLYHVGRPQRGERERESLQGGRDVVAQGGEPGQPYELSVMRHQSADRIRSVAATLRAIASTPNASARAIGRVQRLAGQLVPQVEERLRRQLTQARSTALAMGRSQPIADINAVAAALEQTATQVAVSRRHAQREATNAILVQQRQEMLMAIANRPSVDVGLGASLLYILDEEIQATAVTYSSQQRDVLEGRQTLPLMGASPRGVTVRPLTLPPVTGSPAMQALLNEARLIFGHPYENHWWEPAVREYARRFPRRLINDIEARNEGIPFYRSASGAGGHTH